jgi:hypothetical protein
MDAIDVPDEMPAGALPEGLIPRGGQSAARQPMPLNGPAGGVAPPPRRTGSRRGAARRVALFMAILAGTGFGVMLWVDPVFRQKTVDWCKTSYAKLHAYATAEDMKGKQASPSAARQSDESDAPILSTKRPDTAVESTAKAPVEQPKEPEVTPAAKTPEPPPAAAPAPAKPSAPAPTPAPSAVAKAVTPAPAAPHAQERAAPAKAPTQQDEAIPDTYEGQVEREKQLFQAGLQAEFGRTPNYEAALKAYTDIKKLPKEVWPNNLDTRINDVKRKMK